MREESPLFKAFVELYYKYADQKDSAGYQILNASVESDIDTVDSKDIDKFYDTYGPSFPRVVALDRRNLVKILNKIYEAKGTEKAIKLLFRSVFNDEIKISYPGEQRLKASDGVWVREKYITINTLTGALPQGQTLLSISNELGNFTFETLRSEVLPGGYVRVYFQSYFNIYFNANQRVINFDETGAIVFAGDIVASPSYLEIVNPGVGWRLGQTFVIPGSSKNSLARVSSINTTGGILGVDILEYGYNHSANQILTLSPYPIQPETGESYVESVLTSVTPTPVYTHTLRVSEPVKRISEKVGGVVDTISGYFSQDYVENSYIGASVLSVVINQEYNPIPQDTDLTIAEWELSRATFVFRQENVVTTRGYYETDTGQVSNSFIKLQDNYFYQAYSYLIKTSKDINEYEGLLKIIHPAGLKQFANLTKSTNLDITTNYANSYSIIQNVTH